MPTRANLSGLVTVLVLCLWAAGCGGGCSGSGNGPAEEGADPTTSSEGTGGEQGSRAEPPPPVDPGPVPVLRVTGTPDEHSGEVAIRVENRGTEAAELLGELGLQRREGESWTDVGASLSLRFSCEDSAPECVTLAPGAVYIPPPWLGLIGDAQCDCERCAAADPGEYRFVVRSCSRAHVVPGEPFTR